MPSSRLRALALAAALAAAALASTPARANCRISATGVAFGNYDPQSPAPTDGAGSIEVECHKFDPPPTVDLGTGGSGTYFPRRMTSGPWTLDYNLYADAGRTLVWGDGTGGTQSVSPPPVPSFPQIDYNATVYGRIPALQNVGSGVYADTVIVTVTW